ncbi:MAG: hypothetical protein GVY20_09810 [Bacteroidetes bacterium]|nr:hypothetical protein [Bacteroidota bacterium]
MKKFIDEAKDAKLRFNELTGEEKRKAEEYLRKLEDRMQSEHNVTILNNGSEK